MSVVNYIVLFTWSLLRGNSCFSPKTETEQSKKEKEKKDRKIEKEMVTMQGKGISQCVHIIKYQIMHICNLLAGVCSKRFLMTLNCQSLCAILTYLKWIL